MTAALALSSTLGSAYRAALPSLVDTWLRIAPHIGNASSAASSSAAPAAILPIPEFPVVQKALQAAIDGFIASQELALPLGAGVKEAAGLELRAYLMDRLSEQLGSADSHEPLALTCASCDVALLSAQAGLLDFSVAFTLMEETADLLPISACASLWEYAEARRSLLMTDFVPGRMTALNVLRASNELLRRITKSDIADANFGGRILGFVSEVFPLDERAGRNQPGNFNTANVTKIEPVPPSKQEDEDGQSDADAEAGDGAKTTESEDGSDGIFSPGFYEDFWALQKYFSNPKSLAEPHTSSEKDGSQAPAAKDSSEGAQTSTSQTSQENSLGHFFKLTERVLEVFKKVQEKEKERAYSAKTSAQLKESQAEATAAALQSETVHSHPTFGFLKALPTTSDVNGLKRKRGSAQTEEPSKRLRAEHGMQIDNIDSDDNIEKREEPFFPKFLTGRQLLKYELQDPSFRLHILLQYFVLVQYILSWHGGDEKWGPDKCKNPALQRPFVLNEVDNTTLRRKLWLSVSNLVRTLMPRLSVEATGASFVTASSLASDRVPVLLATNSTTKEAVQGPELLRTANQILRREQHWVAWKMNACEPPIERSWVPKTAEGKTTREEEERKALRDASAKLSGALKRKLGPPGSWDHALGTPALSRLWERGFPPPVEGTRMRENEEGIEELCKTDGLEVLEGFVRDVPRPDELAEQVKSAEGRALERKAEIQQGLVERKTAALAAKMEAQKKRKAEEEEERKKKEEGEADDDDELEAGGKEEAHDSEAAVSGDKAESDPDVEMKDVEEERGPDGAAAADSAEKPGKEEPKANGTSSDKDTTGAFDSAAAANKKEDPEVAVSDSELRLSLNADEDYSYLDEGRLNASWKYLRLARLSTVSHWKDLDPSSVATVLSRIETAEKQAKALASGLSVPSSKTFTAQATANGTPAGDSASVANDGQDTEMKVFVVEGDAEAGPAVSKVLTVRDGPGTPAPEEKKEEGDADGSAKEVTSTGDA